jgi:hypothetical protein
MMVFVALTMRDMRLHSGNRRTVVAITVAMVAMAVTVAMVVTAVAVTVMHQDMSTVTTVTTVTTTAFKYGRLVVA